MWNYRLAWISSPIVVLGKTHDEEGKWGRLLRWLDPKNQEVDYVMPMRLQAEKTELFKELLNRGLEISPARGAREHLYYYLCASDPNEIIRRVSRVGWFRDDSGQDFYVLPDHVFGRESKVHYAGNRNAYKASGTVEEWQAHIGKLARGNSRLVFSISVGFAGALLEPLGEPSGGFHLWGGSRLGKSTSGECGNSVTGAAKKTWRGTHNGMEAVCAERTDSMLFLDELGQVEAKEAGAIVYTIANETGKSRAVQDGGVQTSKEWRIMVLSNGEMTLRDKMTEAGQKIRAGQEVRLIDIPADAEAGYGLFEDIHDAESADEFADQIKAAARRFYGAPLRAFLESLVETVADPSFIDGLREWRADFIRDHKPEGASGQVSSVCGRFAVVALAGELATAFGITGWEQGEAEAAALKCFHSWLEHRGTLGDSDIERGVQQVRSFIERYGSSRFEVLYDDNRESIPMTVHNRAGYRKQIGDNSWQYMVLPEQWREEVCKGFNADLIAKELATRELLICGEKKRLQKRIRAKGGRAYVYILSPDILGREDDADGRATERNVTHGDLQKEVPAWVALQFSEEVSTLQ